MLPKVVPCADPVDPANVLNEILAVIHRHVIIDPMQAVAVTLWIAMTWFMPCINVAPLLIITAPERACGKSQLLSIALRLVFRGLSAANTSAPFLFRALAAWAPTILIDEADTFIRENAEIKGMINAGHTRESAYVGRAVAKDGDFEPQMFSVWGAKVLAGIALEKHLSDATMSRGIIAGMRRKMPTETIERLRHADKADFDLLASQLARFTLDYSEQVSNARPNLPDALDDRAQDNWEPLLAIAACAGQEWADKAVAAALALSKSTDESVSPGNELLADIQEVFKGRRDFKISSADLIAALVADSEAPWATYNRGWPLTPRQLSKMLSAYNIKSKTVRRGPHDTPKGYGSDQFSDAFSRYLPQQRHVAQEVMQDKGADVAATPQQFFYIPGTTPPGNFSAETVDTQSDGEVTTPETTSVAKNKLWQNVVEKCHEQATRPEPFDKRPDSDF
jgi:hypothetical protein